MKLQQQMQQQQRPSDCLQPPPHAGLMPQPPGAPSQPSPQQQQLSPNNPQQAPTSQPQAQPQLPRKAVPNEQYIKHELLKLEREKERLKREQEDVQKRVSVIYSILNAKLLFIAGGLKVIKCGAALHGRERTKTSMFYGYFCWPRTA